jgi:hypothetical protein
MRYLLALLIAFATLHAGAAPASTQSIEKLLAITQSESLIDSTYDSLGSTLLKNVDFGVSEKPLNTKQQHLMDTFPAKIVTLMRTEYGWDLYKPRILQIYKETFTQQEIDGLVRFYASHAGQAYIQKMPLVMQQTLQLMQSMSQTMTPKIAALIEQQRAELNAAKSSP